MRHTVFGFTVEPCAGFGVAQSKVHSLNTWFLACCASAPAEPSAANVNAASTAIASLTTFTFDLPLDPAFLRATPAARAAVCRLGAGVASPTAAGQYLSPLS